MPSGKDDKVGSLKAAGELIQIGEAGGNPHHLTPVLVHVVDLVEELVEHVGNRYKVFGLAPLRDRKDGLFGRIEGVFGLNAVVVRDLDDLRTGINEAAKGGGTLDDPGVVLDVDRGRDRARQRGEVGVPADILEPA